MPSMMNSSFKHTEERSANLSIATGGFAELKAVKFTVYVLICLFSVTGNTFVILSVIFFQRLKTVPNMFIANLAACDLMTTISSIPFDLPSEELGYWPYGGFMCKILWPLATFSTTSASFTLVSISADRYGALLYPLNFRYKITKRKCVFVMCFVYALAALAVLPYVIFLKLYPPDRPGAMPQCGEEWPELSLRKSYTVFLFSIQYGIPLIIMCYIYLRLGCLLQENTRRASDIMSCEKSPLSPLRKISQLSDNSAGCRLGQRHSSLQRRKEQNDKTVKMFFVVVLIFLVFMLPNQILWLLYDFGNSQDLKDHIDMVAFVCRAFTYTNSVLNAVIYGACNSNFRRAFEAIIRCKCGKSHQREAKRSLTVLQGRVASEINHSKTITHRSPARSSPRKPDSTETVDGSSNSEVSPTSSYSDVKKNAVSCSQHRNISVTRKKGQQLDHNELHNEAKALHGRTGGLPSHTKELLNGENMNNNCRIFTFKQPKETTL